MSYGLETIGGLVGGMAGGGIGLVKGAVTGGVIGAGTGAVVGGTVGAVVGAPTVVGEVATIPSGAATGAVIGGVAGAGAGGAYGAVTGTQQGVAKGQEWGKWLSDKIDGAQTKAKDKPDTKADTKCATCKPKPCEQFACGVPGSKYRGGAHWCMKEPGKASHHMPPAAASPIDREVGPAIQMEKIDHYATPSYGRNSDAPFMKGQRERMAGGNLMGAFAVDAAAVEAEFPGKYTAAIGQAATYAKCLEKSGAAK